MNYSDIKNEFCNRAIKSIVFRELEHLISVFDYCVVWKKLLPESLLEYNRYEVGKFCSLMLIKKELSNACILTDKEKDIAKRSDEWYKILSVEESN